MDKKFMMKRSEKLTERVFSLLSHVFTKMIAGSVFAILLTAQTQASAPIISFMYDQDPSMSPQAYVMAREAMDDVFKGSRYDRHEPNTFNPIIGIAEYDLNGDNSPEIIALPTETDAEIGLFCKNEFTCPHYILDTSGKKVRTIGIVWANSVDRGPDIINGYWTLKATFQNETDPTLKNLEDLYIFDPQQQEYIKNEKITP